MARIMTTLFGPLALLALPVQAPMRESSEWLTDVSDSHNGTESRLQLRGAPRREVQYDIPEQAWQRSDAYSAQRGALRRRWAVPMWSEAQYVGDVAAGATSVACETTIYDLRPDSLALLYASPESWRVVELSAVGGGSVTFPATTTLQRAYLIPLRLGYLRGDAKRKSNGHTAVSSLLFDLDDNIALTSAAPAQFLGKDIYFDEILSEAPSYESSLQAPEDRADYELGVVSRRAPWLYTRQVMPYHRQFTTPAQVFAFRQWLHRRAGRYREFWAPSYENDMRKRSTGLVGATFDFARDGYSDWAQDRTHVAFEDAAGVWHPRTLSNLVAVDSATLRVTLSSALNIQAANIRRVSFLGLRRLTADSVELNWVGGGVCTCTFNTTELSP